MTTSKEGVLISKILAKHGACPDRRLWRNETAGAWVGKRKGTTDKGDVVLRRGARLIQAGLCKGSADIIGLIMEPVSPTNWIAVFVALEVKTKGVRTEDHQSKYLEVIVALGGIAAVVRSVEDVDELLGRPPR